MQKVLIAVINKKDHHQYWVNQYNNITLKYENALRTSSFNKIIKIINQFRKAFIVLILTADGELINKYQ